MHFYVLNQHGVGGDLKAVSFESQDPIDADTADGTLHMDRQVKSREFGRQLVPDPYVLKDSLNVIAPGRLTEQGYGMYWPPYENAFMVDP